MATYAQKDPDLIREHFRIDGDPKTGMTKEEATLLATEYNTPGFVYSAYRCSWPRCGQWHVGSRKKTKAENIAEMKMLRKLKKETMKWPLSQ